MESLWGFDINSAQMGTHWGPNAKRKQETSVNNNSVKSPKAALSKACLRGTLPQSQHATAEGPS